MTKGFPLIIGGLVGIVTGCPVRYLEGQPFPKVGAAERMKMNFPGGPRSPKPLKTNALEGVRGSG